MSISGRIVGGRPSTAFIIGLVPAVCSSATRLVVRGFLRPGRPTLADLDDRLLADIGVSRSEVTAAAQGLLPLGGDSRGSSRRPTTSKRCASLAGAMRARPPRSRTRS